MYKQLWGQILNDPVILIYTWYLMELYLQLKSMAKWFPAQKVPEVQKKLYNALLRALSLPA